MLFILLKFALRFESKFNILKTFRLKTNIVFVKIIHKFEFKYMMLIIMSQRL